MRTARHAEVPDRPFGDSPGDDINVEEALARAAEFYPPLSGATEAPPVPYSTDSGTDLMTKCRVNVRVTTPIPDKLKKDAGKVADYMDDLGTIMSAHVRKAARSDLSKFYDLNTWQDAYLQLELMTYEVIRTYEFKHVGAGAEVSTKIIEALVGAVGGNKLAAGKAFLDFLSEQQGRLKAELGSGRQAVRLIAMSTSVAPDELDRLYGYLNLFLFDETNSRKIIETSCASAHQVNLRATGMQIRGKFPYSVLRRPSTLKAFEEWIEKRINDDLRKAMDWKKTEAVSG